MSVFVGVSSHLFQAAMVGTCTHEKKKKEHGDAMHVTSAMIKTLSK